MYSIARLEECNNKRIPSKYVMNIVAPVFECRQYCTVRFVEEQCSGSFTSQAGIRVSVGVVHDSNHDQFVLYSIISSFVASTYLVLSIRKFVATQHCHITLVHFWRCFSFHLVRGLLLVNLLLLGEKILGSLLADGSPARAADRASGLGNFIGSFIMKVNEIPSLECTNTEIFWFCERCIQFYCI